ncbi:GNAT family N-acetyltransferase [Sphingomonas sp. EC-HK361]|uniref:GNAT family N-acetyltransferase n=1 Tax=Sphingomonas sp. EC-HK361 TaxID=2038397 RepID=UPI001257B96E|nr:N-acetyltransferase [Sphingomonas sp. EC-HK361]VVT12871.1 GNAT family N-acetyltransferase [Sphingomonas sp. EC-HK361]
MIELAPLETIDAAAVEQLLDRAFGADRHARTAYRLREETRALSGLSLAAVDGDTLVGSIQCWPVRHIGDDGACTSLVLVGPVAVDPAHQQAGIGRMLMGASLIAAGAQGLDGALMLVGDPDYYERFFGFTADATARWRLPGPVERHRLLARGALVPRGPGEIAPRVAVIA